MAAKMYRLAFMSILLDKEAIRKVKQVIKSIIETKTVMIFTTSIVACLSLWLNENTGFPELLGYLSVSIIRFHRAL